MLVGMEKVAVGEVEAVTLSELLVVLVRLLTVGMSLAAEPILDIVGVNFQDLQISKLQRCSSTSDGGFICDSGPVRDRVIPTKAERKFHTTGSVLIG